MCYLVLWVCALLVLAAAQPTNKINKNDSSSISVLSGGDASDLSDVSVGPGAYLNRNSVLLDSVLRGHWSKRVRRTALSDGKKCSTGKKRIGSQCIPCALLEKQNPHACKETLDSLLATYQETLPQQSTSTSATSRHTNIISTKAWSTGNITMNTSVSSPIMTTTT